jgi:hypothetical protein
MMETFKQWLYGGIYYLQRYYKWYLLVVLIGVAIEWLQRRYLHTENLAVLLVMSLVGSAFVSAMHYGLYKLSNTGTLELSYWRHFVRIFPELFIAYMLFTIAGGIGFLLLIVPGFIIMTRFMFFPYLMLEYDISIKEAFLHSQKMTEGVRTSILGVLFLMIIASISEVPFIQSIYITEDASQQQKIFTGIIYAFAIFILHPLSIATLLYAYTQMHNNLITEPEPEN